MFFEKIKKFLLKLSALLPTCFNQGLNYESEFSMPNKIGHGAYIYKLIEKIGKIKLD